MTPDPTFTAAYRKRRHIGVRLTDRPRSVPTRWRHTNPMQEAMQHEGDTGSSGSIGRLREVLEWGTPTARPT